MKLPRIAYDRREMLIGRDMNMMMLVVGACTAQPVEFDAFPLQPAGKVGFLSAIAVESLVHAARLFPAIGAASESQTP